MSKHTQQCSESTAALHITIRLDEISKRRVLIVRQTLSDKHIKLT